MFDYKNIPIEELAQPLGLRKGKGANWHCFNPSAHKNNDNHPSLSLNNNKFHCHGCGVGGNSVELVKLVLNKETGESIEWLKQTIGNSSKQDIVNSDSKDPSTNKEESWHIRYIREGSIDRYGHILKSKMKERDPTQIDVDNIKKFLGKSYSLKTLQKLNIKFGYSYNKYCMVFQTGEIIYNPNNKKEYLHVEGRTDFLSAVDISLDNYYGIVSDFNKQSKIEITDNGEHYFILDSDVTQDNKEDRIKCDSHTKLKFIRLPEQYNDLSEFYNHGDCTSNVIVKLIDDARYKQSNTQEKINISADPTMIKKYISDKKLINVAGEFYQYINGLYQKIPGEYIKQEISEVLGNYSQSVKTLYEGVTTFAYTDPSNINPTKYINLMDCLFDIDSLTTQEHTPEILTTNQIPIKYRKDATCPKFEKFMIDCIPNEASRLAVQEYLGYSLSTQTEHQKALFLIGTGANGKGTLLKVISMFFGEENIAYLDLCDLSNQDSRTMLFGKLINMSTEMSGDISKKDFKFFKQITSFETIIGKFKYNNSFNFQPTTKCIFSVNEPPKFPENNLATFRRLLFADFPNDFSEEKGNIDLHLFEKLKKEREGIFLWLIAGLVRLREQGKFSQDTYMIERMNRFKIHNNSIGTFINDCCSLHPGSKIKKSVLYQAYKIYCEFHDVPPESDKKFGREIKRMPSIRDDRNEGGRYIGISVDMKDFDKTNSFDANNGINGIEMVLPEKPVTTRV